MDPVKHGNNGEFGLAHGIFEELGIAHGPYDIQMLAQVIAYAARDSGTDAGNVAEMLIASARAAVNAGENVNVFWFKDRKFAQNGKRPRNPGKVTARTDAEIAGEDRKQYEMWLSMSAAYKAANPWVGAIPAADGQQRQVSRR